jgi:hypothetical protein
MQYAPRALPIVAFVIAAALASTAVRAEKQAQAFIVEGASLATVDSPDAVTVHKLRETSEGHRQLRATCVKVLVHGHSINRGATTVIAFRRYDYSAGVMDSGAFMKLSVEMPRLYMDKTVELPSPGVRAWFSAASDAFVGMCAGAVATSIKGSLRVSRNGSGAFELVFHLTGRWLNLNPLGDAKSSEFHLEETLPVRFLTLDELDAWQAGDATSPKLEPRQAKPGT